MSLATMQGAASMLLTLVVPRAGLDSFAALSIMQHTAQLAAKGHAVLATIHQPRAAIWACFQQVPAPVAASCVQDAGLSLPQAADCCSSCFQQSLLCVAPGSHSP